jgi:hypothetical protein
MQLVLFALVVGVTWAVVHGARLWRDAVMRHPLLSDGEKLQSKDAVVVLAQSVVVLLLTSYLALAATGLCFPGKWVPLGVVGVWVAVGQTAGWVLGFLFGHPEIIEKEDPADKRTRRVKQNSSLAQVTDWLTKAIVGVGLVQAQNIMRWVHSMATELGKALDGGATGGAGYAVMLGVLVVFPILGFLTGYLVTRTFLVLALCRADVAASQAANVGTQSEQALFNIDDSELESLNQASLQLGAGKRDANARVNDAVEKIVQRRLESLESWKHIRLWAKAQLIRAQSAKAQAESTDADKKAKFEEEARTWATEAERGFQRAVDLVPYDAETRLGFAVAMAINDAAKREVLTQLELARDSLMAKSGDDLRKDVFNSLLFRYLYLPEPESFQKTLNGAKEYFAKENAIPSGSIWVNVACAYGLAAKWLNGDASRTLDIKQFGVNIISNPQPQDNSGREQVLTWLKRAAVRAAREAVSRDGKWKQTLRKLAGKEGGEEGEMDLLLVKDELTALLGE